MKKMAQIIYMVMTVVMIILSPTMSFAYNFGAYKTDIHNSHNKNMAMPTDNHVNGSNCHKNMSVKTDNIHAPNIKTDMQSKDSCCGDMQNNVHCCNNVHHIMSVKISDFLFDILPQKTDLYTDLYIKNLFIDTLSRPPKSIY